MLSSVGLSAPPPLATIVAGGPVSLFLDFDGTLVDLAPAPDAIHVRDGLDHGLADLSVAMDGRCALVSGRSIDELQHYLGVLPLGLAGSHGAEMRGLDGAGFGSQADGLPSVIEAAFKQFADEHGLTYENKPHGGALHYRSCPEKADVVHGFAEKLAAEHGWRAQRGKCVAELVSHTASKGEAVFAFMRTKPFAGSRPYFIGDDLTDEAGFEACKALGGAGVLVGERASNGSDTKAQFALPDVASVHDWLGL